MVNEQLKKQKDEAYFAGCAQYEPATTLFDNFTFADKKITIPTKEATELKKFAGYNLLIGMDIKRQQTSQRRKHERDIKTFCKHV